MKNNIIDKMNMQIIEEIKKKYQETARKSAEKRRTRAREEASRNLTSLFARV